MTVVMPAMPADQEAAWHALMELAELLPDAWTLIGGQMTHLHCAERGIMPNRPTPDVDTVLDVKAMPTILLDFTATLRDIGFEPAGISADGHQHRWVRGPAAIDVLIGNDIGERAAKRPGVTGATTVQTPGAAHAFRRSDIIDVQVGDRTGRIRRPSLVGALVVKAAAHSVPADPAKARHRSDFALLASMLTTAELEHADLSKSERRLVRAMVPATLADAVATSGAPGANLGLRRLALAVG